MHYFCLRTSGLKGYAIKLCVMKDRVLQHSSLLAKCTQMIDQPRWLGQISVSCLRGL